MRIVLLILIAVIGYLVREVVVLKSHIAKISEQNNIQIMRDEATRSPRPQLLLWSSEVSPNGKYRAASYTGDYADRYHYYQVFLTEVKNDRMWRIYTGDFRTSGWEWTDDNQIKITYDCGTGCQASKIISTSDMLQAADGENTTISEENGWELRYYKSF